MILIPLVALALSVPADAHADVVRIRASAAFRAALADLDTRHEAMVAEIVELTEIPAPPFHEAERAKIYAEKFRAIGLRDVAIDAEGNVTGLRPGTDATAKLVVMSAHLDTVFPPGTPIAVRREGTRLSAPGIGDDARGLAAVLSYARALDAARIRTHAPILFVGTVGEEGRGDLRGVRHLFTGGAYAGRIGAFFSVDGADPASVTTGGVGSKRYHIVFNGPGGHSFGAFGIVNPLAAMSAAVTALYAIAPPARPKTTYSASVVGGGTSVNAIPGSVYVDIDLRSEDAGALAVLNKRLRSIVDEAVSAENQARSIRFGAVTAALEPIGDRPAGSTSPDAALVRTTTAAVAASGYTPRLDYASTDANIAMSIGIPAVTIGAGGGAGRAHALDEWIDVDKPESVRGLSVGLLALIAAAGIAR